LDQRRERVSIKGRKGDCGDRKKGPLPTKAEVNKPTISDDTGGEGERE